MRLYFSVMLAVEIDENARLIWHNGIRHVESVGGSKGEALSNSDITDRVKDIIADKERDDDEAMWRVVDIFEDGGETITDGNATIVVQ